MNAIAALSIASPTLRSAAAPYYPNAVETG
jgi:hypothetical protein